MDYAESRKSPSQTTIRMRPEWVPPNQAPYRRRERTPLAHDQPVVGVVYAEPRDAYVDQYGRRRSGLGGSKPHENDITSWLAQEEDRHYTRAEQAALSSATTQPADVVPLAVRDENWEVVG